MSTWPLGFLVSSTRMSDEDICLARIFFFFERYHYPKEIRHFHASSSFTQHSYNRDCVCLRIVTHMVETTSNAPPEKRTPVSP